MAQNTYLVRLAKLFGLCVVILVAGCASTFPRPDTSQITSTDQDSGNQLFSKALAAHGGDRVGELKTVTMDMNGEWHFLVTRIQPLVSDYRYRVKSVERLGIGDGYYFAQYVGPDGRKNVERTRERIFVSYNGVESFDEDVLQSSAMTADAFHLFALGPLSLVAQNLNWQRLSDEKIDDSTYYRIYAVKKPGFGFSERDEIVFWLDTKTYLVKRIAITLEGFRTTQGAWVDVTVNDYEKFDGLVLPKKLYERVRAPIAVGAHRWDYSNYKFSF